MVTQAPATAAGSPRASGLERPTDVLIVGGGLAGLAAGLRLTDAGVRVTILETRKKLGGRATSFKDTRSGEWLDNCQHVVLGCCTNYLDLLARLGAADKITWHRRQFWIEPGGRTSVIEPGPLPAPAHFTGSMLRAGFLSFAEIAMIGRACSRILRVDRRAHAGETFGAFLAASGQSKRVIDRFWAPVVVSACNLGVERVAASSALHVFQEGFLAHAHAADIGVPAVPLLDLYERAESLIAAGGGTVELGAGAERVTEQSVLTTDGRSFTADRVILAVPVERVNRLVDDDLRRRDPRFAPLDRFEHSPILGVHCTFDRPVMGDLPHAVLVDRPTQWLFRKDAEGRKVHAVISAADAWLELAEPEIGQRVLEDVRLCLPGAEKASLVAVRAVKEKLATFAPTPGVEAIRPPAVGSSRLILAGDYTQTGWPATMEGATRSGYTAAAAVLGAKPEVTLRPPLPISRLAATLGLRAG
jgi:hydroxysqualene dehydroxylase